MRWQDGHRRLRLGVLCLLAAYVPVTDILGTVSVRVLVRVWVHSVVWVSVCRTGVDGMGTEVYPNPPLVWVTAEVRYTQSPRLRQQDTLDAIQLDLERVLPIVRDEQQVIVQRGPQSVQAPVSHERAQRLLNRASTVSAVIGPQAATVETSAYTRSEDFLELVGTVAEAVTRHVSLAAVERVGLRYINEIRVPEPVTEVTEWGRWVAPQLIGAAHLANRFTTDVTQGLAQYHTGSGRQMVFRYAALPLGTVVAPSPMQRPDVDTQRPVFVVDIDSFWEAKKPDDAQAPNSEQLRVLLDKLHHPISDAFEAAITDDLRDLMRRERDR